MRTRLVELTVVVNAPQAERIPRAGVDSPLSDGRLHPFVTEVYRIRQRIAKGATIQPSAASALWHVAAVSSDHSHPLRRW